MQTAVTETPPTTRLPSAFRFLWANAVAFQLIASGDRFTFVWLTHETLHASSWVSGLVVFCLGLPMFVFVLPAGAMADRGNRTRQLYASQLGGALVTGLCAVLVWTDLMTIPLAAVAAIGFGTAFAFAQPVRSSLVPLTVPRHLLLKAIPLVTIGANLAQVFGPVIAGKAIDRWNIGAAFALQCALFVLGMALLTRISVPPHAPTSERRRLRVDIVNGLRYVWHKAVLRSLFILMTVGGSMMMGPAFLLVPQVAHDRFHRDATASAGLFGFMGAGMLIMSLVLMKLRHRIHRRGLAFILCMIVGTSTGILIGYAPSYAILALLLFVWGLTGGVWANMSQVLIQEATEPEKLGRVMSITALVTTGLAPLGALASGALAGRIGAQHTMSAVSALGLVIVITMLWKGRALRTVP